MVVWWCCPRGNRDPPSCCSCNKRCRCTGNQTTEHIHTGNDQRWSSKVDNVGTNRKRVCDFLLVRHCDAWSYLVPFLRYGDLLAKIAYFCYPSLIRCPRSLCSLWNFAVKLTSHGAILQRRPHDHSWSCFVMIPDCDGQTDRQTDGFRPTRL